MDNDVLFTILVIGIATYLIRVILFFKLPRFADNKYIEKGMHSIPATMLVALVVPFAIIFDETINLFRNEVYTIIITIFIVWKIKKPSIALLIAMLIYFLLEIIFN